MPRHYTITFGALLVLVVAILAWRALTPAAPQTVAVVIEQGAAIPDRLTLAPGRAYRLAVYSIGVDRWLAGSGAPSIHAAADRITYADFEAPTAGFWTLQATNGAAQLQIDVAANVPPARSRTLLIAAGRIIGAGPVATGGQVNLATPDAQASLQVDDQARPLSAGRIERWDAPVAAGTVQLATADERLALPIRRAVTSPAPFVGAEAPAFSLPRLDGGAQTLDDLRGRGVVMNFWATWCAPCREEFSLLVAFSKRLPPGVDLLSVDYKESPSTIRAWFKENGYTLPDVAIDTDGATADRYATHGFPTTFFIDAAGIVRMRYSGPLSEAMLQLGLSFIAPAAGSAQAGARAVTPASNGQHAGAGGS